MTKVNELPLNVLACIFFLLQNKHMMIEKLLKFLISVVDAKLLKTVRLPINKYHEDRTLKISKPAISRTPIKDVLGEGRSID